ncbi:acyl-CoA dehydrogenase family protein [Legionella sp. W05-934-2]|jgi:alkylation response protein AidB-like acyl-CoA dehydrogenase|uniref:acyl-CoA dehydrogenase family protein n=1 Tax=Legionella sp. W05-934-2 TaxID=1198649 RepID=UPI003461A6D6
MGAFYQNPPSLDNQYTGDVVLRDYLAWRLPKSIHQAIEADLTQLGERVVTDIYQLGQQAESSPPKHIPYDAWGKRIDHIEVSHAWQALDKIAAEEGLVAIGYQRQHGIWSRVYQFCKLYLFHPSSAIYTCPLAMTDGAARAIELYGDDALKKEALTHLTSTNPEEFWTSGQWMTERTGGSDVSGTSTIAVHVKDNRYHLSGDKWFTSATTSQMAMTLARIEGAEQGSKGLSLFYLPLRDEHGQLNGIQINRLKDKLGTKALPTAELTLINANAKLVGEPGNGVKKIASLFNITRIYNACCAVGYMRRAIALASDYAQKRQAFGRLLSEQSLHVETLATMQLAFEAGFHLVFHAVELLGKEELGQASEDESKVLRLLTPLIKLFTAKQAIMVVSEALEAFGGAGYVEDTGLPQLLRDAQVLSIWEGTTNILSLDALRAIAKEKAAEPFFVDMRQRLATIEHPTLQAAKNNTEQAILALQTYFGDLHQQTTDEQQRCARELAFSLTRTYAATLLLEQAQWANQSDASSRCLTVTRRWCAQPLVTIETYDAHYHTQSKELLWPNQP